MQPGDIIEVTVEEDTDSRLMTIPQLLATGLEQSKEAHEFFSSLTDSQKNKFITYITSAKKEATRISRLEKVMHMLHQKEKMK